MSFADDLLRERTREANEALAALADARLALEKMTAERDRWKADFDAKAKAYAAVYEELMALKQGRA